MTDETLFIVTPVADTSTVVGTVIGLFVGASVLQSATATIEHELRASVQRDFEKRTMSRFTVVADEDD